MYTCHQPSQKPHKAPGASAWSLHKHQIDVWYKLSVSRAVYFAYSHTRQRSVYNSNDASVLCYCSPLRYSENALLFLSCIKIKINSGMYLHTKTYRIDFSLDNDSRNPHSYLNPSLLFFSFKCANTAFDGCYLARTSKILHTWRLLIKAGGC